MTPRSLRSSIQRGEMTAANPRIYRGQTPAPPPEWPTWRQDRMKVAIRAAVLFLQGKSAADISRSLEQEGLLEQDRVEKRCAVITKQRCQQYVSKGIQFFLDRGCFVSIKNPKAR